MFNYAYYVDIQIPFFCPIANDQNREPHVPHARCKAVLSFAPARPGRPSGYTEPQQQSILRQRVASVFSSRTQRNADFGRELFPSKSKQKYEYISSGP